MKYASIGTVSHATFKDSDLIEASASELEYQVQRNADYFQSSESARNERERILRVIWDAREYDESKALEQGDYETGTELVQKLMDYLNKFAAPYCYFGSHAGDSSDFGYWIDFERIEECAYFGECIVLNDAEIPEDYSGDAICINEHGNTLGYRVDKGQIVEVYFEAV